MVALVAALPQIAQAGATRADILDYFALYYQQQVVKGADVSALEFLRNAAAQHASNEQVLKPSVSRSVTVDRRNGYLQIDGNSGTDQTLTMALYGKADGTRLVVAGSSDCADACVFSVEFFVPDGNQLKPVPSRSILPAISSPQFIKSGRQMPKALALIDPKIDYVPARVGTALTLRPSYGYEAEEQMDAATRSAIQSVELQWDHNQGIFVLLHKR
jgi:hypothetical protein